MSHKLNAAQREAIGDIRDKLRNYKNNIVILKGEIELIDIEMNLIRSSLGSADSVKSSGASENKLDKLIDAKTRLELKIKKNEQRIENIESRLKLLPEEEQKILKVFYQNGNNYVQAIVILEEEIGFSESAINEKRRKALSHYAEMGVSK